MCSGRTSTKKPIRVGYGTCTLKTALTENWLAPHIWCCHHMRCLYLNIVCCIGWISARPISNAQLQTAFMRLFYLRPITRWSSGGLSGKPREFSSWGGLRTYMLSALIRSEHSYPACTAGAITGILAVRSSWSSRTRDDSPQNSNGHAGYGPNCLTTF